MKNKIISNSLIPLILMGLLLIFTNGCSKKDTPVDANNPGGGSGNWSVLGSLNVSNSVYTLTSDRSGNIYAAGGFKNSSGFYYVAKWNGTAWTDIGMQANNYIRELVSDPASNVYAIGDFTDASNNYYIAKWNGSSWTKIYNTLYSYSETRQFTAICTDPGGNEYASNGDLN